MPVKAIPNNRRDTALLAQSSLPTTSRLSGSATSAQRSGFCGEELLGLIIPKIPLRFLSDNKIRSSIISVISVRDLVNSFSGLMDGEDKDPFRFSVLQSTKSSNGARNALAKQNYKPILSDFYGESVGKLLSRLVPRGYVGYAAEVILRDWRFPFTWREHPQFLSAIYRGFYINQNTLEKEEDFVRFLIQQTAKTPKSPLEGRLKQYSEPTSPSVAKLTRRGAQVATPPRIARNPMWRADISPVEDEDEDEFMAKRRRIESLGTYS